MEETFASKPLSHPPFTFAVIRITSAADGRSRLEKPSYSRQLLLRSLHSTYDNFRSLRHQIALLGQTRPDLMSIASIVSQATPHTSSKANLKLLNTWAARTLTTPNPGLSIHRFCLSARRILVYADAVFGNISDHCMKLRYMILLTSDTARANHVYFSSNKSEGMIRSVLDGDLYAVVTAVSPSHDQIRDLASAL